MHPRQKRKGKIAFAHIYYFSLSLSLFLIAVFREVQLIYKRLLVIAELSRAQRSTMGEKIWLSIMHSINFGSEKIVRTSARTSTPSCKKRGKISHVKYSRVSVVNCVATLTVRKGKKQQRIRAPPPLPRVFLSTKF